MLTMTESAHQKILTLLEAQDRDDLVVFLAIRGRGPGGFQYEFGFVPEADRGDDDVLVDAGGFQLHIDPESAPNLEGATLDFVEDLARSGFKIDNPNPVWTDPLAQAVQQVIDTRINPSVAMHGGFVTLLEVKDNVAYIALGGGCQGCGVANVTLRQGIEVMIREAVPEIHEIVDATDHAAGTNPYYHPSKGGQSPLA
jgi:Fe/S biogenesis protein NfuA